jgi:hypothetical protein
VRWLYLHGFASGPDSFKGRWLSDHYAARGIGFDRLDLRVPSFATLRLSEMITHTRTRLGERAVVFGSSLGGLTAARVAEADPRVAALVLMAPAFDIAARWKAAQPAMVRQWEADGWLEVDDHANGGRSKVDWGFWEDAARVDAPGLPRVTVPTLVVHGTGDTVVGIERSRAWVAAHPNARLVEVADDHELRASLPRIAAEADAFLAPWLP